MCPLGIKPTSDVQAISRAVEDKIRNAYTAFFEHYHTGKDGFFQTKAAVVYSINSILEDCRKNGVIDEFVLDEKIFDDMFGTFFLVFYRIRPKVYYQTVPKYTGASITPTISDLVDFEITQTRTEDIQRFVVLDLEKYNWNPENYIPGMLINVKQKATEGRDKLSFYIPDELFKWED